MKRHLAIFALTAMAALPCLAHAADDHHLHHQATRGGVFVAAQEADYELVAKPERLQLYVFNHGTPRNLSQAAARLMLLAGTDKQEVVLKPAGDKLEATGSFKVAPGTKVVVVVSDAGKTFGTARFVLK